MGKICHSLKFSEKSLMCSYFVFCLFVLKVLKYELDSLDESFQLKYSNFSNSFGLEMSLPKIWNYFEKSSSSPSLKKSEQAFTKQSVTISNLLHHRNQFGSLVVRISQVLVCRLPFSFINNKSDMLFIQRPPPLLGVSLVGLQFYLFKDIWFVFMVGYDIWISHFDFL